MDRFDISILSTLAERGRISAVDLGEVVGLSPTACAKRIQQLEAGGIIVGYSALLGLEPLGYRATVIVTFTLDRQTEDVLDTFERAIAKCASVIWCFLMAGVSDYMACVIARDIADYERIHKEQLSRLPGVAGLQSTFAMRQVVRRSAPSNFSPLTRVS